MALLGMLFMILVRVWILTCVALLVIRLTMVRMRLALTRVAGLRYRTGLRILVWLGIRLGGPRRDAMGVSRLSARRWFLI